MKRAGKKKCFIASFMALALTTAMPGGMGSMARVYAEEGTEKVQLDAPTNLRWGPPDESYTSPNYKYAINWEGINESITDWDSSFWIIEVYKDGELFDTKVLSDSYYDSYWDSEAHKYIYTDVPKKEHTSYIEDDILESGSYKFRVLAEAYYKDQAHENSEWTWSESITYVRPEQELGVVTDIVWDSEKAGVCHFTALESEYLEHYHGWLYKQDSDGEWWHETTWGMTAYKENNGMIEADFSDDISRYGEGKYYITIQAASRNIDVVANGKVTKSGILDTSMNAENLSGLLSGAADKTAVETKELLTSSADISAVQQAMQTDDTFREQIQTLESRYAQEQNINVEPPAVSESAKEYVDPNQVSVVGAAFNAAQGKAVNLQMDVTPEEEKVFSGYKKDVQLDIKLVSDNTEVHTLDVPVSVTMPIPQGIHAGQLVLLHHRADGMTEKIPFHVNSDGTITFTVTSFSTFVFAEESSEDGPDEPGADEPKPVEPEPSNPVPNPGQCDSDSTSDWLKPLRNQIEGAIPGTTIKVTKEQGINTLSRSIMQTLVRRGDISLEMEYTYQGKEYHILIPAGKAVDSEISWYGPLYLSAYFSDVNAAVDAYTYIVQKGDTLSKIASDHHTTVEQLAAANPQIRDVNLIIVGQVINIH